MLKRPPNLNNSFEIRYGLILKKTVKTNSSMWVTVDQPAIEVLVGDTKHIIECGCIFKVHKSNKVSWHYITDKQFKSLIKPGNMVACCFVENTPEPSIALIYKNNLLL